jgi:hypothetical protein
VDHALSRPGHDGLTFDDLGYLVAGLDETFRSRWGKRSAQRGCAGSTGKFSNSTLCAYHVFQCSVRYWI